MGPDNPKILYFYDNTAQIEDNTPFEDESILNLESEDTDGDSNISIPGERYFTEITKNSVGMVTL